MRLDMGCLDFFSFSAKIPSGPSGFFTVFLNTKSIWFIRSSLMTEAQASFLIFFFPLNVEQ